MKQLYTLGLVMIITSTLTAQQIQNVDFYTSEEDIIITYDLVGTKSNQRFTTKLYVSINNGSWQKVSSSYTNGDIGSYQSGGRNKQIRWNALQQYTEIEGNLQFKITATCTQNCIPEGFVFVKGGSFQMGSNNGKSYEKPVHQVNISSFYISQYEVTNEQYCAFLNEKGNQTEGSKTWLDITDSDCRITKRGSRYSPKSGYANHPVTEVTWYGARAYCRWIGGRLPTEAEWEYAARGGTKSNGYTYAGSNTLDKVAWYSSNSGRTTHTVGTKQRNELGIYDMSGNVMEWCEDTWHSSYTGAPRDGQAWLGGDKSCRVLRGGSWNYEATVCRVANRFRSLFDAYYSFDYWGFRVARD